MKKIIDGKLYDTYTAKSCGSWANTYDTRDFHRVSETLYRKKTGEFFLHGEGGPMTQYARAIEQNSWTGGERIYPLNYAEAQKWAEEHLDADEYAAVFGMPDENAEDVQLNVYVPAQLMAALRARASEAGTSVTATVEAALRAWLGAQNL